MTDPATTAGSYLVKGSLPKGMRCALQLCTDEVDLVGRMLPASVSTPAFQTSNDPDSDLDSIYGTGLS